MKAAPTLREKQIFEQALELEPGPRRSEFLQGACGGDRALAARIEALLEAHENGAGFLPPHPVGETTVTQISEKPGDLIGRYKLREKVGEGGCGVVYVAEQETPVRRKVALKVIKLGMDTRQVVARFEAERQALAMMDHPNIAKVLDAGSTEAGRPYFVMELVRGIRITDYCAQNQLNTRERLDLFIKVCQAIQHAHQKGVIHRDIKPSNILVAMHDGQPVPKVIDFGIAKATEGRLTDATVYTHLHQFIGTPAYMSPEQAEMSGLDADTRTDIYSLGVLLYELLTERTPFDGQELLASGLDAMRKTIREKEPVRPSTRLTQELRTPPPASAAAARHGPGEKLAIPTEEELKAAERRKERLTEQIARVKGDLDWIVMRCLEKDRTRRYETANGLAADIQRHLSNEPVVARPPSAVYRFQKAVRRHRLVFTAAGCVVLALLGGIGVSIWQAHEARMAQRTAERAKDGERLERLKAQQAQGVAETQRRRADEQAAAAAESRRMERRLRYTSDINLAQHALSENNLGRARRILDAQKPAPGEDDLRGWEWRYLWKLTRSDALVTLASREFGCVSLSFNRDGGLLACGWADGRVEIWDTLGRRLVRVLVQSVDDVWPRVAFSPMQNLLAAATATNVVTLFNLATGRESILWRATGAEDSRVRHVEFSRDGSICLVYVAPWAGPEDEVLLINVATGAVETRLKTAHASDTYVQLAAALLSPDRRRLFLARSDSAAYAYSIQCVDLATGAALWTTETGRDLILSTLAVAPDGSALASASGFEDATIRIWDTANGRLISQLTGHTCWVSKLAFSEDGRSLISAGTDQTLRVWDTATWKQVNILRGHTHEIWAAAVSPAGHLAASGGKDGKLMLWNLVERGSTDRQAGLPDGLNSDEVMPWNRSQVLLVSKNGTQETFDLKTGGVRSFPAGMGSPIPAASKGNPTLICRWDEAGRIIAFEPGEDDFRRAGEIALKAAERPTGVASHAGKGLIAWSEPSSPDAVYWARFDRPGRRLELVGGIPGLRPFRFSPDGKYLAGMSTNGAALRVWNLETGQLARSVDGPIRTAEFAGKGPSLVVAAGNAPRCQVSFFELAAASIPPKVISLDSYVYELTASADGRFVAASMNDGSIQLFDPAAGVKLEPFTRHMMVAFGIAFSPDSKRLVSSDAAREAVKLWDVESRQELLTLAGGGSALRSAFWSADGDAILTGAPWQVWQAPSKEEIDAVELKESMGSAPR
jgi:eukaryotic-like serine/threonine-protein kinase